VTVTTQGKATMMAALAFLNKKIEAMRIQLSSEIM
jgi:hypothetical protein